MNNFDFRSESGNLKGDDGSDNQAALQKQAVTRSFWQTLNQMASFALVGFVVALLLVILFAVLAGVVFSHLTTGMDDSFSLWIHSFANPGLDFIFNFFTTIGSIGTVIGLAVVIFGLLIWRKHHHAAWLVLLAVGGGAGLDQVLKFIFHRARPDLWQSAAPHLTTYSFPSGHSTVTLCLCGFLSWLGYKFLKLYYLKVLLTIVMVLCILMVGLSRVYLGEHFLTDVIGGFLAGGIWLAILFTGVSAYDRFYQRPAGISKTPDA